jgi:hypothetical protein
MEIHCYFWLEESVDGVDYLYTVRFYMIHTYLDGCLSRRNNS